MIIHRKADVFSTPVFLFWEKSVIPRYELIRSVIFPDSNEYIFEKGVIIWKQKKHQK